LELSFATLATSFVLRTARYQFCQLEMNTHKLTAWIGNITWAKSEHKNHGEVELIEREIDYKIVTTEELGLKRAFQICGHGPHI
jgi:hypothetical protein